MRISPIVVKQVLYGIIVAVVFIIISVKYLSKATPIKSSSPLTVSDRQLKITKIERNPYHVDTSAQLRIFIRNTGENPATIHHAGFISIFHNFSHLTTDDVEKLEDEFWNLYIERSKNIKDNFKKVIPPDTEVYIKMYGPFLTDEKYKALQVEKTDTIALAGIIKYKIGDLNGPAIEYCSYFVPGSNDVRLCSKHNGPS
jgi:hypothetical protein